VSACSGVIALLVFASNCSTPQAAQTTLETTTAEKPSRIDYNGSGTMALEIISPVIAQTGSQPIHFRVIRMADSTVVYQGDFMRGYVKWVDDSTLEKLSVPQKLREGEDLALYTTRIQLSLQSPDK
jgi:hypothetical protein